MIYPGFPGSDSRAETLLHSPVRDPGVVENAGDYHIAAALVKAYGRDLRAEGDLRGALRGIIALCKAERFAPEPVSARFGQYAEALKIDHTNRDDIYTNLIRSFTEDEKLDTEEHNFIINEIKSRNDLTPEDASYGKIMYEIGNAYWLYYDPHTEGKALQENELEKDRITVSYEWLEKAVGDANFAASDPETYSRASVFYSIGTFYVEIDRKQREGTDNQQFYRDMWKSMLQMSGYIDDFNEVISARVCQTLCSLISRYSPKFRQVGITEKQQTEILDRIEDKIYQNGEISYLNNYSVGIAEQIHIDAVRLKLAMAYAE